MVVYLSKGLLRLSYSYLLSHIFLQLCFNYLCLYLVVNKGVSVAGDSGQTNLDQIQKDF